MNEHIEKLISLKFAKETEHINSEIEERRRSALADLSRKGMIQSGMTVQMMLDTGLDRLDRLARAKYSCTKQVHADSGQRLTPESIREFESLAEEILQNGDQQLGDEIKEKYPTLSVTVTKIASGISGRIEGIRARLRRDCEIEATTMEMQSQCEIEAASSEVSPPGAVDQYRHDVFVSFTNADQSVGERIQRCLLERKMRVFFSPKDLQSADEWAEVIRGALVSSREICLVVSKRSLAGEWVLAEWGAGWVLQRRTTPILVDCQIQDLPARLQAKQCVRIEELQLYVNDVVARSGR